MTLKSRLTTLFGAYSRRHQPPGGGRHQADRISDVLRNRILLLYRDIVNGRWNHGLFTGTPDRAGLFFAEVHNLLQHLYGRSKLSNTPAPDQLADLLAFLERCSAGQFFDFLEVSFTVDSTRFVMHDENQVVDAVNELFRVESAPYQLTRLVRVQEQPTADVEEFSYGGVHIRTVAYPKVIRVEEDVTHSEAIEPALAILSAPHFEVANLELRDALDEYRRGHYKDCLTKCCSSFESVLKVLCTRNALAVSQADTVAPLLEKVIAKSELDTFFQQPLVLIATMRNRLSSSHGGGSDARVARRHVAQYAITITAAAIVLLVHELDT